MVHPQNEPYVFDVDADRVLVDLFDGLDRAVYFNQPFNTEQLRTLSDLEIELAYSTEQPNFIQIPDPAQRPAAADGLIIQRFSTLQGSPRNFSLLGAKQNALPRGPEWMRFETLGDVVEWYFRLFQPYLRIILKTNSADIYSGEIPIGGAQYPTLLDLFMWVRDTFPGRARLNVSGDGDSSDNAASLLNQVGANYYSDTVPWAVVSVP